MARSRLALIEGIGEGKADSRTPDGGENIAKYRSYPRLVGETGGKDFVIAHPSADPEALTAALVRGGFRVPGSEVLRRLARLHAALDLAEGARDA